jgi:hypothetical protein
MVRITAHNNHLQVSSLLVSVLMTEVKTAHLQIALAIDKRLFKGLRGKLTTFGHSLTTVVKQQIATNGKKQLRPVH